MDDGSRAELLDHLARVIGSVQVDHPVRVAIDGAPASGKTTLADELGGVLRGQGREVVRAGIDDFLLPHAVRYRRGPYSAEDCYLNSHDHEALRRELLDPLGPGGDRRYRCAVHDRATDTALSPPYATASDAAVLLFDGVFLMRPELDDRWELRVHVTARTETLLERARVREAAGSSPEVVHRRWHERYLPAQRLYADAVRPAELADVVVRNDDFERPAWQDRRR